MAVETAQRRVSVAVEPNGHSSRVRLHEEIRPPTLDPPTPAAVRSARRALAILAVGMILIQLISAPIGHRLNSVVWSGTDAYSVWQHYASNPVPEVLVIGASTARTDIDEAKVTAELSTAAGRPVTFEKVGFGGQTPLFLDALMYRIMKRSPQPKLIAVVTVGPELNAACTDCLLSVNSGLWDITDLTDAGFVRMALSVSPNPAWLLAGWAFPVLAYYPSLIAMQCLVFDAGRAGATAVLDRVPQQLQNPTVCEETVPYKQAHRAAMTSSDYERTIENYGKYMRDYQISPEARSSLTDIVRRARGGGTNIVFVETPRHPEIGSRFPGAIAASQQQLLSLASSLKTGVLDLSDSVPDDPSFWVDGVHLSRAGANYFGPQLARALAPNLGD
jgi:hypothetical protein